MTEVVVEREGERETYRGRHRGRLVRRGELGQAAARLGQRQAPERPRQRLRPGRAQLHVPQQPGRAGALEGREPDRLPEDARAERLLLRQRRLRISARQHPDGRQVVRPTMYRGEKPLETKLAPQRTLESMARHAVDFWLSTEDLPRPENRVTLRPRRERADQLHADATTEPAEAALPRAEVAAQAHRDAPRPPGSTPRLPQDRHPGRGRARTRPAPAASAPTPRHPC